MSRRHRVVVAIDKFRGTLSAGHAAEVIAEVARRAGWDATALALSDGGEGLLEVFAGPNRTATVTGPLGDPVEAGWRFETTTRTAIIEMARASGLALVGGAAGNDAMAATTTGVGELIDHALGARARRIIVGLGGSATTDGGFGAVRALGSAARLHGVELIVACDVTTRFVDAATVFAPQKGATPAQVELLTRRLERLAQVYREMSGIDIASLPGSGAAGGLAGGLASLGGTLTSGFDVVADALDLEDVLIGADLVITGEGHLDRQSFEGKVVGGVVAFAAQHSVDCHIICGGADDDLRSTTPVTTLVSVCGETAALDDSESCLRRCAAAVLSRYPSADTR